MKNCNECPFDKCLFKTEKDSDICPVERKKQGLIKESPKAD